VGTYCYLDVNEWMEMLMQLWRQEFELDGINSIPLLTTDSERETVHQLCAKQYFAWKCL